MVAARKKSLHMRRPRQHGEYVGVSSPNGIAAHALLNLVIDENESGDRW